MEINSPKPNKSASSIFIFLMILISVSYIGMYLTIYGVPSSSSKASYTEGDRTNRSRDDVPNLVPEVPELALPRDIQPIDLDNLGQVEWYQKYLTVSLDERKSLASKNLLAWTAYLQSQINHDVVNTASLNYMPAKDYTDFLNALSLYETNEAQKNIIAELFPALQDKEYELVALFKSYALSEIEVFQMVDDIILAKTDEDASKTMENLKAEIISSDIIKSPDKIVVNNKIDELFALARRYTINQSYSKLLTVLEGSSLSVEQLSYLKKEAEKRRLDVKTSLENFDTERELSMVSAYLSSQELDSQVIDKILTAFRYLIISDNNDNPLSLVENIYDLLNEEKISESDLGAVYYFFNEARISTIHSEEEQQKALMSFQNSLNIRYSGTLVSAIVNLTQRIMSLVTSASFSQEEINMMAYVLRDHIEINSFFEDIDAILNKRTLSHQQYREVTNAIHYAMIQNIEERYVLLRSILEYDNYSIAQVNNILDITHSVAKAISVMTFEETLVNEYAQFFVNYLYQHDLPTLVSSAVGARDNLAAFLNDDFEDLMSSCEDNDPENKLYVRGSLSYESIPSDTMSYDYCLSDTILIQSACSGYFKAEVCSSKCKDAICQ